MDTRTPDKAAAGKTAAGKPVIGTARMLHTMIRVLDLEKSIDFYTNKLGMTLSRRSDNETGRYTVAFVGYGDEKDATMVELTHNWDRTEPYDLGTAFGHLAIGVEDIYGLCDKLVAAGVKVPRPAGPVKGGTTVIAFIEDPDGYKIELVDRR
jgi:lactoylglutathione lyase